VAVATATADGDEDVVDPDERPGWTFLSNHGHVLVCLAQDPGLRIREIAATVGITERAARERVGRRNRYQVHDHEHLRHPNESEHTIGDLLAGLVGND
jgi:hypothetical protein